MVAQVILCRHVGSIARSTVQADNILAHKGKYKVMTSSLYLQTGRLHKPHPVIAKYLQ